MYDRDELSFVQLRLPDGERVRLSPGSLIGRLSSAELRFSDPNVSEAHALVSLRGRELQLLALRRWFEVDGRRLSELVLTVGQRIQLAPNVVLEVEEINVASRILALTGLDPEPVELSAAVHSIVRRDGELVAEPRYVPDALAHVSSSTDGWVVRMADGTATDIVAGSRWNIDGVEIVAVTVDLGIGKSTLQAHPSTPPLKIVARHDTVHLTPAGGETAVVSGIAARIISELAAFGTPVPWSMVANEIWRQADERLLRQNWDRNMRTLRARLRAVGVRDDLVRPDGHGNTELFLLPDDELVDEG